MISNFAEAHRALSDYIPKDGPKPRPYSLDKMRRLMEFLGNPQDSLRIIHVAGTSGKTSTCYFVASCLTAAGHKVGLTVSPHVDEINERVQINLKPLDEADFCQSLDNFIELVGKSGVEPSYFELLIAFAYYEFARRKVDYAVIETGLGGLLDGTNVVGRRDKVCAITDIGLDHTEVLGDSLAEIATQKAGIIQPGNVVFAFRQGEAVMEVLETACAKQRGRLQVVEEAADEPAVAELPLFQRHNWQLARRVVEHVLARDKQPPMTQNQLLEAMGIQVPARMEAVRRGDKTVVFDGAHNPQKLRVLAVSMLDKYPGQDVAALVSFSREKQLPAALEQITALARHIIITRFAVGQDAPRQAVDPKRVAAECRRLGFEAVEVVDDPRQATQALLARPEAVLLVTGSFYLLNHVRPAILKS